jgi:hypothetical protein
MTNDLFLAILALSCGITVAPYPLHSFAEQGAMREWHTTASCRWRGPVVGNG